MITLTFLPLFSLAASHLGVGCEPSDLAQGRRHRDGRNQLSVPSGISLRRPRLHLGGRSSLYPQASAQGWRLRLLLVDEPVV